MLERNKWEVDDKKNEGTNYSGENCAKKEKTVIWKIDTKKWFKKGKKEQVNEKNKSTLCVSNVEGCLLEFNFPCLSWA